MMRPRILLAIGAVVAATSLSGCSFGGIYSLPLPGAVANGGNTYTVKVQFRDALDLVPYSSVKVNDAVVGHVHAIHWRLNEGGPYAEVDCKLKKSVHLPKNAIATIAETSLLGEKFVALAAPRTGALSDELKTGDTVSLAVTDRAATVEEVLSALSLILNGGGLAQVKVIAAELNNAFSGRESTIRDALERLQTLVGGLNEQRTDIIRALESVNKLAATLRRQETAITGALETMPPALGVLNGQRTQLTKMLEAVDHLGDVAGGVIRASRDDLLANLKALEPTLRKLAEAGSHIPPALDIFLNYPFAHGSDNVFHGDYGNVFLTIDLYPPQLLQNFGIVPGSQAQQQAPQATPRSTTPAPKQSTAPRRTPLPTPTVPIPDLPRGGSTIDRLLLGVLR
jgi:phospholipid/cholesterol/gamma-HCH transport system substrate-binding protein